MTASSSVEAVVFDLGGVVCHFEAEARLSALANATGLDSSHIKAAVWSSGLDASLDRGVLELPDAIAAVIDALENRIDESALLAAWARAFVVDPAMVDFASSLDRASAIFTNNGPLLEECLRRGLVEVGTSFDPILFAGRLGATKPDPISYQRAAAALGRDAATILLIDDAPANVAGALQAGWQAIHFEHYEQLRSELRAAGISP
jgi:HAD superfamily hydrolase (TIGR01509 family)